MDLKPFLKIDVFQFYRDFKYVSLAGRMVSNPETYQVCTLIKFTIKTFTYNSRKLSKHGFLFIPFLHFWFYFYFMFCVSLICEK